MKDRKESKGKPTTKNKDEKARKGTKGIRLPSFFRKKPDAQNGPKDDLGYGSVQYVPDADSQVTILLL